MINKKGEKNILLVLVSYRYVDGLNKAQTVCG